MVRYCLPSTLAKVNKNEGMWEGKGIRGETRTATMMSRGEWEFYRLSYYCLSSSAFIWRIAFSHSARRSTCSVQRCNTNIHTHPHKHTQRHTDKILKKCKKCVFFLIENLKLNLSLYLTYLRYLLLWIDSEQIWISQFLSLNVNTLFYDDNIRRL